MRRPVALCALVVAIASVAGTSHADELDEWCAGAKKASSIVICSDAQLREQAIARNKLFETARAKLSPEAYKTLSDDQSRWIKVYTAGCGISIDDPPPTVPIPQRVIDCYRRESRDRTAQLTERLSGPGIAAAGQPAPSAASGGAPPDDQMKAYIDAVQQEIRCLDHAVGALDDRITPAEVVAAAAQTQCMRERRKSCEMVARLAGMHCDEGWLPEELKEELPQVVATVLKFRRGGNRTSVASDQTGSFLELPGGPVTWTYDLRTVDLVEPGKFTVTVILGLNPDVMAFKLNALDTLRPLCNRSDGQYPAPAGLLTLGEPDMRVETIRVRTGSNQFGRDEKMVEWPVPYRRLADPDGRGGLKEELSFVVCWGGNPPDGNQWYSEKRNSIMTTSRVKYLFDCNRGVMGSFVDDRDDASKALMGSVRSGFRIGGMVRDYLAVCRKVTGNDPYPPR